MIPAVWFSTEMPAWIWENLPIKTAVFLQEMSASTNGHFLEKKAFCEKILYISPFSLLPVSSFPERKSAEISHGICFTHQEAFPRKETVSYSGKKKGDPLIKKKKKSLCKLELSKAGYSVLSY